jgi:hypothetical protein
LQASPRAGGGQSNK